MPINTIEVEWAEGSPLEVRVWDADGVETDITHIFNRIKGGTGQGQVWSEIEAAADSLIAKVSFKALAKELKFTVTPGVINQLLQVAVAHEAGQDN